MHGSPLQVFCTWMHNLEIAATIYEPNQGLQVWAENSTKPSSINELAKTILAYFKDQWDNWEFSDQTACFLQLSKLVHNWKEIKEYSYFANHWKQNPEFKGLKELIKLRNHFFEHVMNRARDSRDFFNNYLTTNTFSWVLRKAENEQSRDLLKACSRFLNHHSYLISDPTLQMLIDQFEVFYDSTNSNNLILHHNLIQDYEDEGIDFSFDSGEEEEDGNRYLPSKLILFGYVSLNLELPISGKYDLEGFFSLIAGRIDEEQLANVLDNSLVKLYQSWEPDEKECLGLFDACQRFPLPKLRDFLPKKYPQNIFIVNPAGNDSEENPRVLICLKKTLIQASPYFDILLNGPFQEGGQNVLKFKDESTFKAVAFAIGNLIIDLRQDNWESYLQLAEQFQFDEIKQKVEDFLLQTLKTAHKEDYCKIYTIAQTYHLTRLKVPLELFFNVWISRISLHDIKYLKENYAEIYIYFNPMINRRMQILVVKYIGKWWTKAILLAHKSYKIHGENRQKLIKEKKELASTIRTEISPFITKFNINKIGKLLLGNKYKVISDNFKQNPSAPNQYNLIRTAKIEAQLIGLLPHLRQVYLFSNIGAKILQVLKKCNRLETISLEQGYLNGKSSDSTVIFHRNFNESLPEICQKNPNLKKLKFFNININYNLITFLNDVPQITQLEFKSIHLLNSWQDRCLLFIREIKMTYFYSRIDEVENCELEYFSSVFPHLTSVTFDFRHLKLRKILVCERGGISFSFKENSELDFKSITLHLFELASHPNIKEIEIRLPACGQDIRTSDLLEALMHLQLCGKTVILPELGFEKKAAEEEKGVEQMVLTEDGKGKEKVPFISGEASRHKRRKVKHTPD